jgi:hypothetical protein
MCIALWVMPKEECPFFLDTLAKLNVPIWYIPRFKKHVKGKLKVMKSHNYHILFQKVLLVCMKHTMIQEPKVSILQICKIFQLICNKVYDPSTYDVLKVRITTTLCLLEKVFPPSLFDLVTHLVVHRSTNELDIYGPVHFRWMYPIKHAMKNLKGYVQNMCKP